MEIKTKINKWNLIKLKSSCTVKETISKVQREPSDWEKMRANETPGEGLISKTHELNTRKTNNPIKKDTNMHFSKDDVQMADKHMKRCSTLLIIRELQIKTATRDQRYLTRVKMVIIEMSTHSKCWGGCGEKGTLLHCWWECKLLQPL